MYNNDLENGKVIASVIADGVKTIGILLNELYTKVNGVDLKLTTLMAGNIVCQVSYPNTFSNTLLTLTDARIRKVTLSANSSLTLVTATVGGTITYTDESSQVWDNGTVIAIYR